MKRLAVMLLLVTISSYITYYVYAEKDLHDSHCECIKYDCGCCAFLQVKNIINGNLCSNFSYLPEEYGISITITYNDVDIFNETVSAKNPPPICLLHYDKLQMEICLHFYHLDIKNDCFSGCAEFEISFFKVLPLKKIKLGCFGCNTQQSTFITKMESIFNYYSYKSKYEDKDEPKVVLI